MDGSGGLEDAIFLPSPEAWGRLCCFSIIMDYYSFFFFYFVLCFPLRCLPRLMGAIFKGGCICDGVMGEGGMRDGWMDMRRVRRKRIESG